MSDKRTPGSRCVYWLCRCLLCGTKKPVRGSNLIHTGVKQCGCKTKAILSTHSTKHGMSRTPEYRAWAGLKSRCTNPNVEGFKHWGGRGIKVCRAIRKSFVYFFGLVGRRPSKNHSIDRRNNNRHYSCGKCKECRNNRWKMNMRWATSSQQMNNRRPFSRRR
jgi:hypothetical protein